MGSIVSRSVNRMKSCWLAGPLWEGEDFKQYADLLSAPHMLPNYNCFPALNKIKTKCNSELTACFIGESLE